MISQIVITKSASKELKGLPFFIVDKFETWVKAVQEIGIEETRKIAGYRDEPLKGKRAGQRSIRLNKSYRAIYVIGRNTVYFVKVIEVNNHEY